MRRHKYLAWLEWESEFFDELIAKGYVEYEYEYRKIIVPGNIYIVKDSTEKEKFLAISSNQGTIITYYKQGKRKCVSRTMYVLSKSGVEFIQGLLVESKI